MANSVGYHNKALGGANTDKIVTETCGERSTVNFLCDSISPSPPCFIHVREVLYVVYTRYKSFVFTVHARIMMFV